MSFSNPAFSVSKSSPTTSASTGTLADSEALGQIKTSKKKEHQSKPTSPLKSRAALTSFKGNDANAMQTSISTNTNAKEKDKTQTLTDTKIATNTKQTNTNTNTNTNTEAKTKTQTSTDTSASASDIDNKSSPVPLSFLRDGKNESTAQDRNPATPSSSASGLTLSPTIAAPAIVTLNNETSKQSTNSNKTDLIGLFDKFDLHSNSETHADEEATVESTFEPNLNEKSELSDDELKLEKMDLGPNLLLGLATKDGLSSYPVAAKLENYEGKEDVMNEEEKSGDCKGGGKGDDKGEKSGEKRVETIEKVNITAHLMMTMQPYFPPKDSVEDEGSHGEPKVDNPITDKVPINKAKTDTNESNDNKAQLEADLHSQETLKKDTIGNKVEEDKKEMRSINVPTTESERHAGSDTSTTHLNKEDKLSTSSQNTQEDFPKLATLGPQARKQDLIELDGTEADRTGNEDIEINPLEKPSNESLEKHILVENQEDGKNQPKSAIHINNNVNPNEQHQQSHKSFDFQTFLTQLRKKSADPLVRYIRSFLGSYIKQGATFTADQRVTVIADFKAFIYEKFKLYEPFKSMDTIDLENSREGLEKLVMNRLHDICFPPEVLKHSFHQEIPEAYKNDLLDDKKFALQLEKFSWLNASHFDIDMTQLSTLRLKEGQNFLDYAIQELNKINKYRAPRDKIICILNSCKIIFSYLKLSKMETNADAFVPLLILVILKAKTDHLISNIHYIENFRGEEWLLHGETSYYLSSVQGAINFINNISIDEITISQEEYDAHMEAWEAQKKQIEKREEELEWARQEELRALVEQEEKEEAEAEAEIQRQHSAPPPPLPSKLNPRTQNRERSYSLPKSRERSLSQPKPRHPLPRSESLQRLQQSEESLGFGNGLSPSRVLLSSAEMFSRSISNFLSPLPNEAEHSGAHSNEPSSSSHPPTATSSTSSSPRRRAKTMVSPPPPALPPRNNLHTSILQEETFSTEAAYQPPAPAQEEVNSEQMKKAYDILREVFPTLDTHILKDVIFINKGDVDVCIDACLPLVDG
ncbi:conserved hypothetical protein [Lodderomyces elongisporus NRRL YB-4239]|uniref:VPS9 domain-containing protein n=1 Tax=Lodderomyces elongisporus (strain ATCC 11503 / CBS 2605 / JCM 1781 / NBRC 1676 / NRRL YB-4239) TaxID=379508 RepID=A5E5E1_LODEL|nr:conserved hypothetical protein [Lodderomyces elongisporus NRRL YB-4239]